TARCLRTTLITNEISLRRGIGPPAFYILPPARNSGGGLVRGSCLLTSPIRCRVWWMLELAHRVAWSLGREANFHCDTGARCSLRIGLTVEFWQSTWNRTERA